MIPITEAAAGYYRRRSALTIIAVHGGAMRTAARCAGAALETAALDELDKMGFVDWQSGGRIVQLTQRGAMVESGILN